MIRKEELIAELVQHQQLKITELKDRLKLASEAADIDEDNSLDPEDFSHQSEASDIKMLVENQLIVAEQELKQLLLIDTSTKNRVEPGAIVSANGFIFFIGVSFPTVSFQGSDILGISIDTPIYRELKGNSTGDSFNISGKVYFIQSIQ